MFSFFAAGTSVVTDIFGSIGEGVTQFFGVLSDLIESIADLIWVSGTGLTTFGTLLLIGASVALAYFGLRLIMSLGRVRA